jgi:hypothetical protein
LKAKNEEARRRRRKQKKKMAKAMVNGDPYTCA